MSRAQRIDDVSCAICMDPLFNKLNDLDEVCHTAAPNCGESLVHLLLDVLAPVAEALLPDTPSHCALRYIKPREAMERADAQATSSTKNAYSSGSERRRTRGSTTPANMKTARTRRPDPKHP